jgi:hypothetical protein
MRLKTSHITAFATMMSATTAIAADFPVKAPQAAPLPDRSGFYASIDGSQQIINLPTFDLGWRLRDGPGNSLGSSETYKPRVDGYGVSGALGYVVPNGTFSSRWGDNVRFEIGGSYARANGTASNRGPNNSNFAAQMLDGRFGETNGFGPGSDTHTSSTLTTDYTSWNVHLKSASDHRFGAVTLSPSVAVFGGHASNDQSFFQQLNVAALPISRIYQATSSLGWSDWGARLGLDGKWQITNWLSFGLGGSVGTAWRDVSMNATDEYNRFGPFPGTVVSRAIGGQTTTPLLANAEASATIQPMSGVALKAFGGLNFDSRVPGISGPGFTGLSFAPTSVTPAGMKFAAETSYYVGGRLTVGFNP